MMPVRFLLKTVGVLAKLIVSLSLTALLIPIGAIIFLLNWLARSALCVHLRFRHHGRIRLVSRSGDAMFGYTSPGNTRNMLVALRVKKMIDPTYCRAFIQKNVLEYRRANSQPYSKLQWIFRRDLYPYFCWQVDPNFSLENHVQVLQDTKIYTLSDLCSLMSELRKDMSEEHPQWQFLLIPRFGANSEEVTESCVIARVHHGYCDGLSFVNLVSHAIGALDPSVIKTGNDAVISMDAQHQGTMKPDPSSYPYVLNPMTFSIPWRYRAIYNVNCLLFGAYHLLATYCSSWTSRAHFDPQEAYPGEGGKFYDACQDVGWGTIKEIRGRCQVSLGSIVGTCFLAALEHVVPERLPKKGGKVGHTLAILPYPDETFHNRFTMMSVPFERRSKNGNVAYNEAAIRISRLKDYQEQTKKAITGPEYYLYFWFFQFYGQLPGFLLKYVLREARFTFSMANMPFAKKSLLLFNSQVLAVIGWPPYTTDAGLGITLVGYDEKLSIGVTADSAWLSKDELSRILARFLQEIKLLEEACLTVQSSD